MRSFQFSDAKSHKFWTIDVIGNAFTVNYGKVGTAGQSQTKSFPTPEKTQSEADKLIREKTGKGYVETTPTQTATPSDAMEKAIIANPHDFTAWNAYADLLIEAGDVRGEFMQVQLALEDESLSKGERDGLKKKEAKLLKAHEREWLGSLVPFSLDGEKSEDYRTKQQHSPVEHTFSRGWLTGVQFYEFTVNQARALRTAPAARLLQELIVETTSYEDEFEPGPDVPEDAEENGRSMHALCKCPFLSSVRKFRLGESLTLPNGDEDDYMNCHTTGELAYHVVKQMPNLEELYLLAQRVDAKKIFALPMPNLRIVQMYHNARYPLEVLANNKSMANVTHILCHPHAADYDDHGDEEGGNGAYIRFKQLQAICRSTHLTKLTHLRLRLTDFGDKGAKEIVDSGILKRLKVLDLQSGCITDDGAELLANCPDLKNLEYLNLKSNAMTAVGTAALEKTKVKVNVTGQHNHRQPFGDELPEYLYEGDIE